MIWMLICMARGLRKTLDNIATPSSVKAYGALRPCFLGGETKHEVRRKALAIALHGLIQRFDADPVQHRQILVEHDVLSPEPQDPALDPLSLDQEGVSHYNDCRGSRGRSRPVASDLRFLCKRLGAVS